MLTRALAGVALVLSFALSSRAARASACCGTGHGVGHWLAPSERAAASFAVRGSEQIGSWTWAREFAPSAAGSYHRELRTDVGWMVRVQEHVQLGVAVPLMMVWKGARDGASSGGGAGDITAAGRIDLLESGVSPWIPAAALTLAVALPTGRPQGASSDRLGADVTGLGAAELRPGIVLEKSWGSIQALLAASAGFRTRFHLPTGESLQLAPRVQILAAAGPAWPSGVSLAVGGLYEVEPWPTRDGRDTPGATRERTALLAVLACDITTRWTAIGNLQADVPISGIGREEIAFAALSAGVRYVWGRHD
ncbi:hypothetical protein SOCE26_036450 [Sorangium cellulosum]|uniref:Secreted protein n=1 Tax=Sorangium cellulosum TaxID=56 RepID=A0A2L0ESC0_SORCE|nr:hypothetical protein [Sorangium cellulosum]AUX42218.1 hypothetical protein SOCE26_036450 [Sorangium cellulosum]